jgi:ABC-type Fe2+-enterobactin transport system substrate-binding protein
MQETHAQEEEKTVSRRVGLFALALALFVAGAAAAQYPMMDMIAGTVIQKYQQASCEQLWEQRGKPKSAQEQEAIKLLRGDPQMRTAFINKIAAPVANKMFECGMLP